jgi:Uma2 family endonuclease
VASIQTDIPIPLLPGSHPASGSYSVPYRLSVRQFEKMIDAGFFHDDDHVELLGGLLFHKMVKNDPHDFAIDMLGSILNRVLSADWIARQEKSVVLGRFWRPEPDIAVARGPRERYRIQCPRALDIGLLIEVADSTYPTDRGKKWRGYAAARVAVYWVVNLPKRQIEVYSGPSGGGKSAAYRNLMVFAADEAIPLNMDGRELVRFKVSEVLP